MSANQSNPNRTSLVSIIVPAVFLLVGSFIFGTSFVRPFLKSRDAKNWNEISCTIISSQLREVSTRNGTREVMDIVYSYDMQGKTYQSDRYAFWNGSYDAAAIVKQHPPDTVITCYVNPADATDAVIERGFTPNFFVFWAFSFMFMLAGLMGLIRLLPSQIARLIESQNLSEKRLIYWGVRMGNVLAKGGKLLFRLVSYGFAFGFLLLFFTPLIPAIEELGFMKGFTTAITEGFPMIIFIVMIMLIFQGLRYLNRHQQETEKSSWSTFASSRGLTFVPGKFGKHGACVTGTYHHHQLKLETFEKSQGKGSSTYTCLSMSIDTPENGSLMPCKDVSLQDIMSLLTPSGPNYLLKDAELKGSIVARTVDQQVTLCYVQGGIENDQKCLGDVLDLLSDLVDAYSALVASGGEAVPFLKDTIAHHYHKSIAIDLLGAIARDTTARFENRASQVFCPSCLTRYKAHKVLLESLEYISYYGCRICGRSRKFLEGRVIAVLDSRMDIERVQQDGTWRVNWLARQALFDFDEVEIPRATDEEVERLVCLVINDTDEVRRSRYKSMLCRMSADCELCENSRRILTNTFGTIHK